jgi:hypothetical protein
MAHVRASSTTSNSSLVGSKRAANQSSQPEIYHLFFVRVSAGARCLPEDGNELWPISASHWPISGSLVPVLPFPRTLDSAFRNASQSAVEKSRLPEKAPLSSARIDAKLAESRFSETLRLFLDRFHYTRDGDRKTGEYDGRPRRGGIAKEDTGSKHKAEGRKCTAESRSSSFWLLPPFLLADDS